MRYHSSSNRDSEKTDPSTTMNIKVLEEGEKNVVFLKKRQVSTPLDKKNLLFGFALSVDFSRLLFFHRHRFFSFFLQPHFLYSSLIRSYFMTHDESQELINQSISMTITTSIHYSVTSARFFHWLTKAWEEFSTSTDQILFICILQAIDENLDGEICDIGIYWLVLLWTSWKKNKL